MGMSYVVDGAMLTCTMSAAPGTLKVLPVRRVKLGGSPRANIGDSKPIVNIPTFGTCLIPGAPKPCTPACVMWLAGKMDVLVENLPALLSTSTLICTAGGGVIRISYDGQK